jgi:hypothetical protein
MQALSTKMCFKCKEIKPLSHFYLNKNSRYDTYCVPCRCEISRNFQRTRAPKSLKPRNVYERERRAALGTWVLNYLQTHPCVVCGESDPIVLDFDHIRGKKKYPVTYMISHQYCLETVIEEIAKCQVLCANCHRRKTAKEQNWSRLRDYSGQKAA